MQAASGNTSIALTHLFNPDMGQSVRKNVRSVRRMISLGRESKEIKDEEEQEQGEQEEEENESEEEEEEKEEEDGEKEEKASEGCTMQTRLPPLAIKITPMVTEPAILGGEEKHVGIGSGVGGTPPCRENQPVRISKPVTHGWTNAMKQFEVVDDPEAGVQKGAEEGQAGAKLEEKVEEQKGVIAVSRGPKYDARAMRNSLKVSRGWTQAMKQFETVDDVYVFQSQTEP